MITTHTKHIITSLLIALVAGLSVLTFLWPQVGEAKSVTWNTTSDADLFIHGNSLADDADSWTGRLLNHNVTVKYLATVIDNDTGSQIGDGDTVPVGSVLCFEPTKHRDTHITWNGVGTYSDTPYGHWDSASNTCKPEDAINPPIYIPLVIQSPVFSLDLSRSTANLRRTTGNCYRITSEGNIRPRFNFGATTGKFYYAWYSNQYNQCSPSSGAMRTISAGGPVYELQVPAQAINFTLTAVTPNNPPNPPRINGSFNGTTETTVGAAETFTFLATDPDGDRIRYLIDWDPENSNGFDETKPTDGSYINSGNSRKTDHVWNSVGTYTFRARTQDENGLKSTWTPHTVVINQGVNITSCTVTPNPADVDQQVTWTVNHNGGTAPYTYSWSGSGGLSGTTKSVTKSYSNYGDGQKVANVTVTDSVGASDTVDCNILTLNAPPVPGMTGSITADPGTIDAGDQTTVSWSSANTESCRVFSDPSGYNWTGITGSQPATLNRPTDFVLECRQSAGAAYELIDYVSVNVNMPPECSDGIDNDWDGNYDWQEDPGCTGPNDDDESDDPVSIPGCTDSAADNYNPTATTDNGSCVYGTGDSYGCMDSNYDNYDPDATVDDGSCANYGCMDSGATNFNSSATVDDGSCTYSSPDVYGCMDSSDSNFDINANIHDSSMCAGSTGTPDVYGCMDSSDSNFDINATIHDDAMCVGDGGSGCTLLGNALTVTPDFILLGDSVTLTWDVNDCDRNNCTITGSGINLTPLPSDIGTDSATPTGHTTYSLECVGAAAPFEATVEVEQSGQET